MTVLLLFRRCVRERLCRGEHWVAGSKACPGSVLDPVIWSPCGRMMFKVSSMKILKPCKCACQRQYDVTLIYCWQFILCIVRKLLRLAVIKVFGLKGCNVKSVTSEGRLASLIPGVWKLGMFSMLISLHAKCLFLKLAVEGMLRKQTQK